MFGQGYDAHSIRDTNDDELLAVYEQQVGAAVAAVDEEVPDALQEVIVSFLARAWAAPAAPRAALWFGGQTPRSTGRAPSPRPCCRA